MQSLLFYTKSLPFFFCCYRHWNRSSIIVRYLITTASKQAHVKLLERKHLFPDGSLFVPSFMLFSHHNIKYCPNVALMAITPAFWISCVWESEVSFLCDIPSLLTSFLIVWTPRLIKLIHMIYVCRIALFVGLFSFVCLGLGLFVWCVLSVPFFLSPAALSDGDTLWRDCAWEEYSCFLISRHTGFLSCVPEVNVSLISVTNCCILRMCF